MFSLLIAAEGRRLKGANVSRQSLKRVRRQLGLPVNRDPLPAFAWPGGYQLYYLCTDGGALCPACVNDNIDLVATATPHDGWGVNAVDANYEDLELHCSHCNKLIPATYSVSDAASPR